MFNGQAFLNNMNGKTTCKKISGEDKDKKIY